MAYLTSTRRTRWASALFTVLATHVSAQGFDEGSFDTGAGTTPVQTQPAPSGSGGAGDGFDQGSFEPGAGGGGSVAPVTPSGTTPPRADISPDPGGGSVQPPPPPPVKPQGITVDPQITAFETRDFGVPPQTNLRQGEFHGPTPTALPGGYLVTTDVLVQAMQNGTQMVIIDVLGSGYGLPNAYSAQALAAGGSFNDRTQQQAVQWLGQITGGNPGMPIVIYCSDPMCWLSYNASLRTIAAGYSQVYWYRGGIHAWQMTGLPMQPVGF